MKREEKNLQMYGKIMQAAMEEFGTKTYAEASIGNLCSLHGLSKGIIYHYFKDKDELYLSCVKNCITSFAADLQAKDFFAQEDVQNCLQDYFSARFSFFEQNPLHFHIFYEAQSTPPRHLAKKVAVITAELDALHISFFKSILQRLPLRAGITEADALDFFVFIQQGFHNWFYEANSTVTNTDTLLRCHETQIRKNVDFMLHGMVKENCECLQ